MPIGLNVKNYWRANQTLRFLLIGGYNTAFGYITFALLFTTLNRHVPYLALAVISHFISIVNAYLGHRILVFQTQSPWFISFIRYNISNLGILGISLAIIWFMATKLGISPLLGQATSTGISVIISYFMHKHLSFRQQHKKRT